MKTSLSITGFCATIISALIAAPFVPGGSILSNISAAFDSAQEAVSQSKMPREQKATVSNVLKTKHDTVKNSIGNIR